MRDPTYVCAVCTQLLMYITTYVGTYTYIRTYTYVRAYTHVLCTYIRMFTVMKMHSCNLVEARDCYSVDRGNWVILER